MFVDCEQDSPKSLYELLISAVVPRPIAWVSTCNNEGVNNLAPFSFFNVFSVNTPVLGFYPGVKRKPGSSTPVFKDSLKNVLETQEFVVNIVNMELAEKMVQSSGDYDESISEFGVTGLTPIASTKVRPPRVGESPISMECKLFQIVELGSSNLVLGRIVCLHISDEILDGNAIDINKLRPVARLGGDLYAAIDNIFAIVRPEIKPR